MSESARNWKLLEGFTGRGGKYPLWFLNILANRGITEGEAENFLNAKYESLSAPEEFQGIAEAVKRIRDALKKDEKIFVYGDYDVDGICATAMMFEALSKIGVQQVESYIPHREEEGYGLNPEAVAEIKEKGASLIITVDCGITSKEIIDNSTEIDFIVCDHHEINKDTLPVKAICIHPQLVKKGGKREFSAAGMAFYLVRALAREFPNNIPDGQEKWMLDLAALSTICDVVPLRGENRIIAKWGLTVLSKTRRKGLIELMKAAGIERATVGSYEAGFILGPRLNAAGRLSHAKKALKLLLTDDPIKSKEIAEELNNLNQERQSLCVKIFEQAKAEVLKNQLKKPVLVLANSAWPRGVVGIIASRVSDTFGKPAIVFEESSGDYHGSARSVEGFDITEVLGLCSTHLTKFGGHAKAAGLTLEKQNLSLFEEAVQKIAEKKKLNVSPPVLEIDSEISPAEINLETVELLEKLEPFGYGNSTPVFKAKITPKFVKPVGKTGTHYRFSVDASSGSLGAIYFNAPTPVKEGAECEIAFNLRFNVWNNKKTIELRVIDIKKLK